MTGSEAELDRRRLYALRFSIALVSAAVLLLQIAVTRILSVTLWYHFSFLAISVAMLGLGLGSAFAARRSPAAWSLPVHAALFALTTPVVVFYAMRLVPPPVSQDRLPVVLLTFELAVLVIPFLFAGACVALMLRIHAKHISTLYAWDLVGAAAGALVAVPLLNRMSAPNVVLAAALGAAVGAAVLRTASPDPTSPRLPRALGRFLGLSPLAALGVTAVLFAANWSAGWLEVRHTKGNAEEPLVERWSALARVTVFQIRAMGYRLVLDGCAATAMYKLPRGPEIATPLRRRGSALAFHLRQQGTAVIVGPGGGEDVITALTYPDLNVIAAEINPTIIRVVDEDFGDDTSRIYSHPRVEVVVTDGRNFFTRRPGAYDIVHLSMVDTFAASAAGALALTENNLYTVEAFSTYLDNLAPAGVLSVTWWKHATPTIAARMVTLARTALSEAGAARPEDHLTVLEHAEPGARRMTILVKRSPFTGAERDSLREVIERERWDLLYPAAEGADLLTQVVTADAGKLAELERAMAADIAAPTDDQPFLFYTHGWRDYFGGRSRDDQHEIVGWVPVFMLATLLWSTLAAGGIAVAWPWVLRSPWRGSPGLLRYGGFFVGLGLGFLAIEALLIQIFVLFLGHPSYALTCVLFALLLAAGTGSDWAGRRWRVHELGGIRRVCLVVTASIVVLLAIQPWKLGVLTELALGWRLTFAVVILAPLGFLMGMPFQAGLRALGREAQAAVPWAWSINAVTSVLGSVLAMLIALHQGFTVAGWFGAGAYAVAALALPVAAARRDAS